MFCGAVSCRTRNPDYGNTDHEQGMICTCTDDPDLDAVLRIPLEKLQMSGYTKHREDTTRPGKAIKDIDIVACVEIIDGALTVDLKSV